MNGRFELLSNRRNLWLDAALQTGDGAFRRLWNLALLSEVVAPTYARLLSRAARFLPPGSFQLWPGEGSPEPWDLVSKGALKELASSALGSVFSKRTGGFVSLSQAVILVEEESGVSTGEKGGVNNLDWLEDVLVAEGETVTVLPRRQWEAVCTATSGVNTLRAVTPAFVRAVLRRSSRLFDREKVCQLLQCCTADLTDGGQETELVGLPLLPLSNGTTVRFRSCAEDSLNKGIPEQPKVPFGSAPCFLVTGDERRVLAPVHLNRLVDVSSLGERQVAFLERFAHLEGSNVSHVSDADLLDLLPPLLPTSTGQEVKWASADGENEGETAAGLSEGVSISDGRAVSDVSPGTHITHKWLESLWAWLSRVKVLTPFLELPIVPVEGGKLCSLPRGLDDSFLLHRTARTRPEPVRTVLEKMGCRFLDGTFAAVMNNRHNLAQADSLLGMLATIRAGAKANGAAVGSIFEEATTDTERDALMVALSSGLEDLDATDLETARKLPVLLTSGGSISTRTAVS